MELASQIMRKLAPELDPLRIGTGWKTEDLSKTQVVIEITFGDSHPGSGHLNILVEEVRKGIDEAGGYGARYFCTDICDGESQGTDGINYSLVSREMIANMIEIHANATPFDAAVFLSSCDKGLPGNLMGLARVNIPSLVVPEVPIVCFIYLLLLMNSVLKSREIPLTGFIEMPIIFWMCVRQVVGRQSAFTMPVEFLRLWKK